MANGLLLSPHLVDTKVGPSGNTDSLMGRPIINSPCVPPPQITILSQEKPGSTEDDATLSDGPLWAIFRKEGRAAL